MKLQLIMLSEQPIIVYDEEIPYNPKGGTNGNFFCISEVLSNIEHGVTKGDKKYISPFVKNVGNCQSCREIIAGIPGLPSIDFSIVRQWAEENGIIDFEKISEDIFENFKKENPIVPSKDLNPFKLGFIKGFKTAQSLNEKKFSLEELKHYHNIMCLKGNVGGENYINSLSQPKIFEVEVEMELIDTHIDEYGDMRYNKFQPKITNNQIKIVKLQQKTL